MLTANEKNKRYWAKHPYKHLREKFKLTPDEYQDMLVRQNGVCAICGNPETKERLGKLVNLAVDHDRACCPTGTTCGDCVRGLLCSNCNVALGLVKESPEILFNAIKYLAFYEESNE